MQRILLQKSLILKHKKTLLYRCTASLKPRFLRKIAIILSTNILIKDVRVCRFIFIRFPYCTQSKYKSVMFFMAGQPPLLLLKHEVLIEKHYLIHTDNDIQILRCLERQILAWLQPRERNLELLKWIVWLDDGCGSIYRDVM